MVLENPEEIVLVPHAAVGEAIMLSGVAKLYRRLGYRVSVSSSSQLKQNREAFQLIFQKNPFIAGEKELKSNDRAHGIVVERSPFRRVEFDPGILRKDLFCNQDREVELFYRPRRIPELRGKTILDLNISDYRKRADRDNFEKIASYIRANHKDAIWLTRGAQATGERTFSPLLAKERGQKEIHFGSIYEYCDIVSSCRKVVCLQTGSQMLACYYNGNVECLCTEKRAVRPNNPERLTFIRSHLKVVDLS